MKNRRLLSLIFSTMLLASLSSILLSGCSKAASPQPTPTIIWRQSAPSTKEPVKKPETYEPQVVNMGEVARFGDAKAAMLGWYYSGGYYFDVILRNFGKLSKVEFRDVDDFSLGYKDDWFYQYNFAGYYDPENEADGIRKFFLHGAQRDDFSPGMRMIISSRDGKHVIFNVNEEMNVRFDVPEEFLIPHPSPLHDLEEKISAGDITFQITNVQAPSNTSDWLNFEVIVENNGSETISIEERDFYAINSSGYIDVMGDRLNIEGLIPGDRIRDKNHVNMISTAQFEAQPNETLFWLVFDGRRFGGDIIYFDMSKYIEEYQKLTSSELP